MKLCYLDGNIVIWDINPKLPLLNLYNYIQIKKNSLQPIISLNFIASGVDQQNGLCVQKIIFFSSDKQLGL